MVRLIRRAEGGVYFLSNEAACEVWDMGGGGGSIVMLNDQRNTVEEADFSVWSRPRGLQSDFGTSLFPEHGLGCF